MSSVQDGLFNPLESRIIKSLLTLTANSKTMCLR
jgi:hypothetical protein